MNYNHSHRDGSTIILRVMCAIVFLTFSFLWLYFFQADVLAVAQHVLSHGKTHYNGLLGAVLITLVLWMLQVVVAVLLKLSKRCYAFTFLPSMLMLGLLSDIDTDIDRHISLGAWWWGFPLILIFWGVLVLLARVYQSVEPQEPGGIFSRRVWVNMLVMALMMIGVVSVANTQAAFHYRAHIETSLLRGDFEEALRVGERSLESDASLTMLRVYALARQGELGERLFHYPVSLKGIDVLPLGSSSVRTVIYPADSIYRFLGAVPKSSVKTTAQYLSLLEENDKATPAVRDYQLCAMLIDKDIDGFARAIGRYYEVNDSLPRHYREALVLYHHLRSHPVLVLHDEVMETDYSDFRAMEDQLTEKSERKVRVGEKFYGTYWYYYYYL